MLRIVLVHPQIPPNTGNVGRLCVAIQAELHLVHPLGFSISNTEVKRAGLDYWQDIQLKEHPSWPAFLEKYSGERMHFFSKKVSRPYCEASYQAGDFLIFGSETQGLSKTLLQAHQDRTWTIPMWGPTRSLNLATSVGIVTYEALRQITLGFSKPLA